VSLCLFVSLFYFAFLSVLFCVCADDVNVVVLLMLHCIVDFLFTIVFVVFGI